MVKVWLLATLALVGAVNLASAQSVPRPSDETIRSRQKISLVEGSLERAVQNGAANFARQVQAVSPNADGTAMLLGAPVVRGFPIEHFGVFFDVQMPSLQLSMVWPMRFNNQQSEALRRSGVAPVSATAAPAPLRSEQTPSNDPQPGILDDPAAAAESWRNEVAATLIDAMIENTGSVTVKPDEVIVVAARAMLSSDRMPDPGETRTIELTLKGSDLLAYRANQITLEEARQKVQKREY